MLAFANESRISRRRALKSRFLDSGNLILRCVSRANRSSTLLPLYGRFDRRYVLERLWIGLQAHDSICGENSEALNYKVQVTSNISPLARSPKAQPCSVAFKELFSLFRWRVQATAWYLSKIRAKWEDITQSGRGVTKSQGNELNADRM
jgi:hypothetical protein